MKKIDNEQFFLKNGINGIIFLPLIFWFLYSLIITLKSPDNYLPVLFFSPVNVVFGLLFFIFINYHINFEIIYLIKTYFKKQKYIRNFSIIINLVTFVTTISVILAILQLHFSSILTI